MRRTRRMHLARAVRLGAVFFLVSGLVAATAVAPAVAGSSDPNRAACPTPTKQSQTVTLLFYDRSGNKIATAAARKIMKGSDTAYSTKKTGWRNAALIDLVTLCDLKANPLATSGGRLHFNLYSTPVAFEVNWPTTRGYSMMILDNGGTGFSASGGSITVNFTYQAALDSMTKLNAELAARPDYRPSAAFTSAYNAAAADIATANGASDQSVKGKYGQLALDQLATATDLMLYEYGTYYAHAHLSAQTPWLGLTLDTITNYQSNLDLAEQIAGPYGWVRIVMDPGTAFSVYAPMVDYAHSIGLKVMGQPIDSSYAKRYLGSAYLARFQAAVAALPTVDAWEVGNEINGSWLGADMGTRVDQAAAWVKANTTAKVVVTFYWQIGTDTPETSMFNWERANLLDSTVANTDIFFFSWYPEDAPMGLAFDQVMRALHNQFPTKQIGIGELDYWASDTSQAWWYGDDTSFTAGRKDVASEYYRASLGYPYSVGGEFWWYFAEEMPAHPALAGKVSGARDAINAKAE